MQKIYQGELLQVIQADLSKQEILERLENYHFSDIADALEQTETEKRLYIYSVLGLEKTAEIFSFYEYVEDYIKELSPEYAADLLECMHSDDAVDMLNKLDEDDKDKLIDLMEEDAQESIVQQKMNYIDTLPKKICNRKSERFMCWDKARRSLLIKSGDYSIK